MIRRDPSDRIGPTEDRAAAPHGDAAPFPAEQDWLALQPPAELTEVLPQDFVGRTLAALAAERREQVLPRHQLEAFGPPAPTADFVARTLQKLQQDRHERWRGLLAKYVAPEPDPRFVARTVRALAHERPSRTGTGLGRWPAPARFWLPVAAAAAALLLYFGWDPLRSPSPATSPSVAVDRAAGEQQTGTGATGTPRNVAKAGPSRDLPEFAYPTTSSPLPSLLVALEAELDPEALPSAAANGRWLAEARR